jgi:uncharacterized PurR-regulated membrane protein YhhQ (DUF165 family)
MKKWRIPYLFTGLYLLYIVLLNTVFSYVPNFSLGHYSLSWADFLVGIIYVMRDLAQRESKHWVLIAMLVACFISYLLAEKQAAFASVAAFIVGESIDWSIFTFTQKSLSQRILISSLISCPADSIVNLYFLNLLDVANLTTMLVMKLLGVFCLWYYWKRKEQRQ